MAVTIWRSIEIAALVGAATIALAAVGPAVAQSPSTDPSAPPAQNATPAPAADARANRPQAQTQEQKASDQKAGTSAVVMDLSAIQGLIGKGVTSSAGEDMGRIIDLLVTPTGQVRAAVIDFGGFLGVGSRKVAVDWKALSFTNISKSGSIRLALTRDQVRVSPEYKSGDPVVILETNKPTASAAPPAAPEAAKPPEPAGK